MCWCAAPVHQHRNRKTPETGSSFESSAVTLPVNLLISPASVCNFPCVTLRLTSKVEVWRSSELWQQLVRVISSTKDHNSFTHSQKWTDLLPPSLDTSHFLRYLRATCDILSSFFCLRCLSVSCSPEQKRPDTVVAPTAFPAGSIESYIWRQFSKWGLHSL